MVRITSKSITKKTLLKLNEGTGYRRVGIYNGVHNQHFWDLPISRYRTNTKCDRKTTIFLYQLQNSVQISVYLKLTHTKK
jgi:hypothetical protein